jgi:hypothetical protein
MAEPTSNDPTRGRKVLFWSSIAAFVLVIGAVWTMPPSAPALVLARAEPAALTPSMQACLSENVFVASRALIAAEAAAERHVGEDLGKARATAWVEAFRLKCDLRPHEVRAAREYLITQGAVSR